MTIGPDSSFNSSPPTQRDGKTHDPPHLSSSLAPSADVENIWRQGGMLPSDKATYGKLGWAALPGPRISPEDAQNQPPINPEFPPNSDEDGAG